MKINMNLKNYGTVNIGEKIENNYNTINLIQELTILNEHCKDEKDKENIKKAIDLINKNEIDKSKEFIKRLGKSTLNLIKELSLSLLIDFIKTLI